MQKKELGMDNILIIDDEKNIISFLKYNIIQEGYNCFSAEDCQEAEIILRNNPIDLILLDINLPDKDGITYLHDIKVRYRDLPVVMLTASRDVDNVVKSIKNGAYDYITKPIDLDRMFLIIENALKLKRLESKVSQLERELSEIKHLNGIVGTSKHLQDIIEKIEIASATDVNVVIQGESGTGKELVAHSIHNSSERRNKRMVVVNCGAIPDTLFESEFFGYEKGAFTSSISRHIGYFEQANQGTLFLDEISEIPLHLQVKLLRAIQEKEIRRIGGTKDIPIDIRIIAATSKDLKKEVEKNNFREDLYYRLYVFPIIVPPLRQRKDDIPSLVAYFINMFNKKNNKNIRGIQKETLEILTSYHWKGNVRELENVIERAMLVERTDKLTPLSLPQYILREKEEYLNGQYEENIPLEGIEKMHIRRVLKKCNYNKNKTTKILGISRATLYRKIKEYNLEK